jgi:hypothetical protein
MKNIFILYVFDIIKLYIFNNIFYQTLFNLSLKELSAAAVASDCLVESTGLS